MPEVEPRIPIHEDELADYWRRFVGFVVDLFVLVMLTSVSINLMEAFGGDMEARILLGLIALAYYVGFTMFDGRTPGKMMTRTRVVMALTSKTPGLGPSVMRWILPGLFLFLPGIPISLLVIYGWLLFDARRRGLHDKAARTVVVRVG